MPWKSIENKISDAIYEIISPLDVRTITREQFKEPFESELPLCTFYFGETAIEESSSVVSPIRTNTMPVAFEICHAIDQQENLDFFLRERAFELVQLIDNTEFLGLDCVEAVNLVSRGFQPIPDNTDQQIRIYRVTYTVVYKSEVTPVNSLDEFLRFNTKYSTDGDPSTYEAEDMVTIREE